ncbi:MULTISPECIES: S-adenosylmethionine--2-demethylmenaquinone methyltransferase [unclassified Halomonas]|uniref:RraA family protein n=1 Tax=unclassified Halomonas TaxID=2609666 RepID=UPI000C915311|nr:MULTISPECIES: S-adenosylmethionine--2-demethylmenaquinone methyltransferase [unclassified Halomonas]MAR72776.1 S-adenosylmethionine--2-demethylmenaquinone methyltransferase [Halomonas sp.]|tara:strand:- start:382 stop:1005 length:624 start_codon:yes stop_codon:yes gene_type:complete
MFHIAPRRDSFSQAQIDRFAGLATSTLGHFSDFGAIASLEPLHRPVRLVGTALTVRIPHVDGSIIREALTLARPGDVLVIDVSGDHRRACWGEFRAYAALTKGLAGVVTNGAVTDRETLSRLALPIFAAGTSPLTTRSLSLEGEINTPVAIDGVTVTPGDLVLGDDDGLFVVPAHRADELAEKALAKQQDETRRREAMLTEHPEWLR